MSSAGQQDPVALLAQQMAMQQAPIGAPPDDPVAALAAGYKLAPATPSPLPPASKIASEGSINSFVRNAANAATFNLADPIAAVADAALPFMDDKASHAPTFSQRYRENVALQRGQTGADQQSHPYVSLAGTVAGGMANPVSRVLPAPNNLGLAMLEGAGMGAGYGVGSTVGSDKTPQQVAGEAGKGALAGAAGGTLAYGLGKALSGFKRSPEAQTLADEGVPLTIGESAGGGAQRMEDASTHIPVMGDAIKSRQADAIKGFNRATYNRVLEPLGVSYPKNAPVGNEGITKLSQAMDNAYTQAYSGASIARTPQLDADLQAVTTTAANTLPPSKVAQIQDNIDRLITSKMSQGTLAPDDLQAAKNWFAEQSRTGANSSIDDRNLGQAYGQVVDAIKDGIKATDPDRGAMLDAADKAYMRFARVAQAASSNNASGKGGIFTAAQLGQALRGLDQSARHLEFAKGLAPMQDLAQAGQSVLAPTVPDSGTALRGLIELGIAGAAGHAYAPAETLTAAGLLGSGTALYSRGGQRLANALLYGGGPTRQAIGQVPWAMLPGALALSSASGPKP